MGAIANTLLQFILFSELTDWSSYNLLGQSLSYNKTYQLSRIGNFLRRNKEQVLVNDNQLYKRPTIRINGRGITLRDNKDGANIGTKNQFRIYKGQFLLSKIDARNGAFGVVPAELDNGIITGNFWTFDVDYSIINPHYLTLLTGTKEFQKLCQTASVGTTNRNYLKEDLFLKFKIPLPTLSEQDKLVNDYAEKINKAKNLEQRVNDLEKEIERYLFDELGVEINQSKSKSNLLQEINFKEITRWDPLFLLGKIPSIKSKFELVDLKNTIKSFNKDADNKSIRIDSSKFPSNEFQYIGMEHIEKQTGTLLEMQTVKGKEIKSQTIKVPNNFFIYGKLRPYLNKYWINDTNFDNVICSSEFFVFDIEKNINKLFFKYVLSSRIIQSQILDKTSGARMPRINEDIFFNLKMPLPPRLIQNEIALTIDAMKKQIADLKIEANFAKNTASQAFENAIFNS